MKRPFAMLLTGAVGCLLVLHVPPATAASGTGDYGDVTYADPGYQDDGKPRYPIDTEKHIRAAWSYIHKEHNRSIYTSGQIARIEAKIVAAWKQEIDPEGPPSAEK